MTNGGQAPLRNEAAKWRLRTPTNLLLGAYLLILVIVAACRRTWITPDMFLVLGAIPALAVRSGPSFIRDWAPIVVIFLAWEAAHGLANNVGFPVHSDGVIAVERMLGFGHVPTVELQEALRTPGQISALDVAMATAYVAHFILGFATAFFFWLNDRRLFARFAGTLLAMSVVQFAFALLLPVAPPRFAAQYGTEALPVADVLAEVAARYGPERPRPGRTKTWLPARWLRFHRST